MSRIGKKPIEIPKGVEVAQEGQMIRVRGSKGELFFDVSPEIKVDIADGKILTEEAKKTKQSSALWGTTRAIIANMIKGVVDGFEKKLEIQGIGYRAEVRDNVLVLNLGFSHQVIIQGGEGIGFKVEKNIITVFGIDKQKVGEFAAKIRSKKKPEPFKGKGIRYAGEIIKRKAGKKAVAATK